LDKVVYSTSVVYKVNRGRCILKLNKLGKAGLVFTGLSTYKSLVEVIEIPDHPWFIASQFHPEFNSTPRDGHPLFESFVAASYDHQKQKSS